MYQVEILKWKHLFLCTPDSGKAKKRSLFSSMKYLIVSTVGERNGIILNWRGEKPIISSKKLNIKINALDNRKWDYKFKTFLTFKNTNKIDKYR